MEIIAAHAPQYLDAVRMLFREYAAEIKIELCFQGFERELAELPGYYAPPAGRIYLATMPESETSGSETYPQFAGCVALRPISADICEMKRLYVRPRWRGTGLGRRFTLATIAAAREIGYSRMRLDTIDTMQVAIALYRSVGFVAVPPYYHNPLAGATFMELDLHGN